jgi:hypothetical protein
MSKYEQLIEFIINEQEDKARELFHQIVVEKSREIYESIIDEQDLEEIGGNPVEDMMDEVTADETGMAEAEDEEMDMDMDMEIGTGDEDMDMEIGTGDEDMGGAGDQEMDSAGVTKMDLENARDDIDAIFNDLMGQLSGEEGGEEMDMDMDMDSEDDEEVDETLYVEPTDKKAGLPGATSSGNYTDSYGRPGEGVEESVYEARRAKKEEMLKAKAKEEKGKRKMTESEWLREYVDQIGEIYSQEPAQEEGHEVGAGKKAKVDKASTAVGPGVNMGGHVVKTKGSEQNPDGKQTPEPSNEYTKGRGNLPHAGKFQNVPGAKTKPTNSGKPEYSKAHGAEGQTTGGKVAVTAKSPVAKA